jgi:hypothetical protein
MQSDGQLHLVSDLPKHVTVSKVLWDALLAGANPHARIEPASQFLGWMPGDPTAPTDLVVETVECTFRYRREEISTDGEQYLLGLVSGHRPPVWAHSFPCTCSRVDVTISSLIETVPGLKDPHCPMHGHLHPNCTCAPHLNGKLCAQTGTVRHPDPACTVHR